MIDNKCNNNTDEHYEQMGENREVGVRTIRISKRRAKI